jgi:hypothetical protein
MIKVKITAKVSGDAENNARKRGVLMGLRIEHGIEAVAAEILKRAKTLVPRDTDSIFNSGRQYSMWEGGLEATRVVGFASPEFVFKDVFSYRENAIVTKIPAEYALYVHEDLEAYHSVGQAKYLSTAAEEDQKGLRDTLRGSLTLS